MSEQFSSSQQVDPDRDFPVLAAAISALPPAEPGGSALAAAAELRALMMLQRRLAAAVLERLASFDGQGFAVASGSASTAAWVRAYTNATAPAATALVAAARTTTTLPLLAAELAAGRISVEHLQAVARSTAQVPDQLLARHDKTLRDAAPHLTPAHLYRAGTRITEAWDAAAAADTATHTHDTRRLSLSQTLNGVWALDGSLTPEAGAKLAAALEPLMAKRGPEDERTPPQRRADALLDLLDIALRSGDLPDCGGDRTRITLLVHATETALDLLHHHPDTPQHAEPDTADPAASDHGEWPPVTAAEPDTLELPANPAVDEQPAADHAEPSTRPTCGSPPPVTGAHIPPQRTANPLHPDGSPPAGPIPDDPTPRRQRGKGNRLRSGPGAWLAGGRLAAVFGDGSSHRQLLGSHAELTLEALTRLGCDADLALAIMDVDGQPLYLSRTTRDPNTAQRRALVIRDNGCVFPGCHRPPSHCQAHHLKFWTRDHGPTDIDNLALVCSFHHWLIHDQHWTLTALPASAKAPAGGWHAHSPDGLTLTRHRQPATVTSRCQPGPRSG